MAGFAIFGVYLLYKEGINIIDENIDLKDQILNVLPSLLVLILPLLFLLFRLETRISNEGIHVRFFPFHLTYRFYSWETIRLSYVRSYNAIAEYGGWGIRFGIFGKGKAFNVSGNRGLQLEFMDGRKLLIGTNRPEELDKVLKQLGKEKNI